MQSGKRIGAVVLDLLHDQRLSEPRLAGLMADRFSVSLVTATIVRISQDCAERVLGVAETVRNRVAAAPVKHRDETGFRMGGKTQWWHVASTMRLTVDRVAAKRGRLPETMTGIVVHDHGTPYSTLTDVRHALCNAHHRRERQARVEIAKADWALRMQPRLRRAGQAVNRACAGCAAEAGTDRADRTAFRRHRRRWPGVP